MQGALSPEPVVGAALSLSSAIWNLPDVLKAPCASLKDKVHTPMRSSVPSLLQVYTSMSIFAESCCEYASPAWLFDAEYDWVKVPPVQWK